MKVRKISINFLSIHNSFVPCLQSHNLIAIYRLNIMHNSITFSVHLKSTNHDGKIACPENEWSIMSSQFLWSNYRTLFFSITHLMKCDGFDAGRSAFFFLFAAGSCQLFIIQCSTQGQRYQVSASTCIISGLYYQNSHTHTAAWSTCYFPSWKLNKLNKVATSPCCSNFIRKYFFHQ